MVTLKSCAALTLCPLFSLTAGVLSLFFLPEQNKEVPVLFSTYETECLLLVDSMQFAVRKLHLYQIVSLSHSKQYKVEWKSVRVKTGN